MKGYKAFEKGMICKGKQYAENTVFEEGSARIGSSGIHFCESPLEVLGYYPLVNTNGIESEFAKVETLDENFVCKDKLYCTKKIRIGEKIGFAQLVQDSIALVRKNRAVVNGDIKDFFGVTDEVIDSSGDYAQVDSIGDSAQIGTSGSFASIVSSGNEAQIGSGGFESVINSTGSHSVICCAGNNCRVSGKIGSWITLAEWKFSKEEKCNVPVCVKTVKIDGVLIKEDTYYRLENGEFVEYKGNYSE